MICVELLLKVLQFFSITVIFPCHQAAHRVSSAVRMKHQPWTVLFTPSMILYHSELTLCTQIILFWLEFGCFIQLPVITPTETKQVALHRDSAGYAQDEGSLSQKRFDDT